MKSQKANKITGANAGGARSLAIGKVWADRIAQFSRYLKDPMKKLSATRRGQLSLALAACFAGALGCAYLAPKYPEPSEAAKGMGPPPGGYILDGKIVESLQGLNR
jgi:hypothetical protein